MPAFVRSTRTFFNQTEAPTGWVKATTHDDHTLRVTSGTTGGTLFGLNSFTTALQNSKWDATITGIDGSVDPAVADLPSHRHSFAYAALISTGTIVISYPANPLTGQYMVTNIGRTTSGTNTGDGVHNHGIALGSGSVVGNPTGFSVKYVDLILASKD